MQGLWLYDYAWLSSDTKSDSFLILKNARKRKANILLINILNTYFNILNYCNDAFKVCVSYKFAFKEFFFINKLKFFQILMEVGRFF